MIPVIWGEKTAKKNTYTHTQAKKCSRKAKKVNERDREIGSEKEKASIFYLSAVRNKNHVIGIWWR